jgi:hypothetical protein
MWRCYAYSLHEVLNKKYHTSTISIMNVNYSETSLNWTLKITGSPWISADFLSPCLTIPYKGSLTKLAIPWNRPIFLVPVLASIEKIHCTIFYYSILYKYWPFSSHPLVLWACSLHPLLILNPHHYPLDFWLYYIKRWLWWFNIHALNKWHVHLVQ